MVPKSTEIKIGVIGLGYVGLPLALEFCKKYKVVGFDTNQKRVHELLNQYDRTFEVSDLQLMSSKNIDFCSNLSDLTKCNVYIITVPTPVDSNNNPDLTSIKTASKNIGQILKKNDYVIYESTVFPGCTEEICVPILEKFSKKKINDDFFVGYSPERINPGDKDHTISKILKITSGSNKESANFIDKLYSSIITAGTYKASSIAVAEAAKVIENTQRDVNIALINELAIIFDKLGLDTEEVLKAAETKWNFLSFRPGLVGGHCIGIDPYYLTYKSNQIGYNPEIILSGRRINDNIDSFIVKKIVAESKKIGIEINKAKIGILGLTFKEDCPDLRNTKVVSIINQLSQYGCSIDVSDEIADPTLAKSLYNINLKDFDEIFDKDILIVTVGHKKYHNLNVKDFKKMLNPNALIIDVKSVYPKDMFCEESISHWRL